MCTLHSPYHLPTNNLEATNCIYSIPLKKHIKYVPRRVIHSIVLTRTQHNVFIH